MPTVLIVEDHQDYRKAVRNYLEAGKVKAELIEAASGEEAIVVAKQKKPQIILMDFSLGGINGMQAANKIKLTLPNCIIVMLTMFDIKAVEALNNQKLVSSFISKSELWDKLLPCLNKILSPLV